MRPLSIDNFSEVMERLSRCINRVGFHRDSPLTATLRTESTQLVVQWTAQNPRVDRPATIVVSAGFTVPYLSSDAEALVWLRACLQAVLLHELDEFLRLDGECVFDPHDFMRSAQPDDPVPLLVQLAANDRGLRFQAERFVAKTQGRGEDPYAPAPFFDDVRRVPHA